MRLLGVFTAIVILASGCSSPASERGGSATAMRAFAHDTELLSYMRRVAARQPKLALEQMSFDLAAPPEERQVAAVNSSPAESITNTQEANVDEGGIVKVAGDHLVILRRGRLITVSLANNDMQPVDYIDAFPPGSSGDGWYDEMLVSGDRVIVIGFSIQRGGTEINRFRVSPDGRLRFEDSYHLRSYDYYSASNYASRLIGSNLILYTPVPLNADDPLAALPDLQRWTGKRDAPFARTLPASRVYVPEPLRRRPNGDLSTLHSVIRCDLAAPRMTCRATAVLGTSSRSFYVSGEAVYVWTEGGSARPARSGAFVYRLPLDGTPPGAVQAWGGPVDQFSFAEHRVAGRLNVVVRADSAGDAMWRSERTGGATALLTLPVAAFGDGSGVAPPDAYRPLPVEAESWSFHNRFVGQHLIYSAGSLNEHRRTALVYAVPLDGGPIGQVPVAHGVDRLDIIGGDAIAIGNDAKERLGFSAIELADTVRLGDTHFLAAAREGERRSQAFFYKPDSDSPDGASGMLGLPVTRDLGESPVARFLGSGSAIAFLRRDARRFAPAGELAANIGSARHDGCRASCVDWYGNARPIFLNGRVFALMGYELVEGRVSAGVITERARVDFAPPRQPKR